MLPSDRPDAKATAIAERVARELGCSDVDDVLDALKRVLSDNASASGPLESVRLTVHDEHFHRFTVDRATGQTVAACARLTPSQAREFAAVLLRYADTHKEDDR